MLNLAVYLVDVYDILNIYIFLKVNALLPTSGSRNRVGP